MEIACCVFLIPFENATHDALAFGDISLCLLPEPTLPRTSDISRSLHIPLQTGWLPVVMQQDRFARMPRGMEPPHSSPSAPEFSTSVLLMGVKMMSPKSGFSRTLQRNTYAIRPFPTTTLKLINDRNPTKGDRNIAIFRYKSDRTHGHTSVMYYSIGKSGIVLQQSTAIVINTQKKNGAALQQLWAVQNDKLSPYTSIH